MNSPLIIKIVEKRKIWYNIGPYGFYFIPPILIGLSMAYLGLKSFNFISVYATGILIYFITYHILLRKMYGWWLINYTIIGSIELTDKNIRIHKENSNSYYEINELRKIQLKSNMYQNYTKMRDIIYDGIGTIQIDKDNEKTSTIYFLIESADQYEKLNILKSKWKENGLSIWT